MLERDLELGHTDFEYLGTDPWFESMHEDPRFRDLLRRMKIAASAADG